MSENKQKNNKSLKSGNYSIIMIAIALAILILINAIVNVIPDKYTKFDMTATNVFDITNTTKEVLKELDQDITIYTIAEYGNENDYVSNFIGIYKGESSHIKSKQINPIENPQFLEDYGLNLTQGSIVVECGNRYDSIELQDMFIETTDSATNVKSLTGLDIEGLLTSTIIRLTADKTPKVYEVYGHDETPLTDEQKSSIKKQNLELDTLDITEGNIPEEGDILIINSPRSDYSDEQTEMILEFLDSGKDALVIFPTNVVKKENRFKNIDKILAHYGAEAEYCTVMENKADYRLEEDNYYYILGQLQKHSITNTMINEDKKTAFMLADSIKLLNEQDKNLSVDVIVQSSNSAYLKEQSSSTMAQLSTDKTGTFNYGVAITNQLEDRKSKMVLYTSSAIVNATIDEKVNGANTELLVSSLRWLADQDEDVMIPVKAMYPANLVLNQNQITVNTIILSAVIPVAILGYGLFVWFRRKTK